MGRWQEGLAASQGLRPASASSAAAVSVLVGGMTLAASAAIVGVLIQSAVADGWLILVWLIAVVQVSAAILLIVGGARLAVGAGRRGLVVGATLQLLICGIYLLYALTAVRHNTTEPPHAFVVMAAIPLFFATFLTGSLILSLRPTTTEYLRLFGQVS